MGNLDYSKERPRRIGFGIGGFHAYFGWSWTKPDLPDRGTTDWPGDLPGWVFIDVEVLGFLQLKGCWELV